MSADDINHRSGSEVGCHRNLRNYYTFLYNFSELFWFYIPVVAEYSSSIHWSVWFFACFREQPLFLRSVVLNSRDMTNKFLVLDFAENRSWFGLTDTLYLLVFKKKSYRCFIIFTANSSKSVSYHLSTNSKPNRINFQFFMSF